MTSGAPAIFQFSIFNFHFYAFKHSLKRRHLFARYSIVFHSFSVSQRENDGKHIDGLLLAIIFQELEQGGSGHRRQSGGNDALWVGYCDARTLYAIVYCKDSAHWIDSIIKFAKLRFFLEIIKVFIPWFQSVIIHGFRRNETYAKKQYANEPTTIYRIAATRWGQDTARRDLNVLIFSFK